MASPQGAEYVARRSADGKNLTWDVPEGGHYNVQLDSSHRVAEIRQGDRTALKQQWHPVGLLQTASFPTTALRPQYGDDLVLNGLLITPPGDDGTEFERWVRLGFDESGRPAKMTDYTGAETQVKYDEKGRLESVASGRGEVHVSRSPAGTVQAVETSWGLSWSNRFDPSDRRLAGTQVKLGDSQASVELEDNLPARVQQFDGGEYQFSYHRQGPHAGRLQQVRLPNDLKICFAYDAACRVTGLTFGDVLHQDVRYDERGRVTEIARTPAVDGRSNGP
jgi:YD repeat-containing protein